MASKKSGFEKLNFEKIDEGGNPLIKVQYCPRGAEEAKVAVLSPDQQGKYNADELFADASYRAMREEINTLLKMFSEDPGMSLIRIRREYCQRFSFDICFNDNYYWDPIYIYNSHTKGWDNITRPPRADMDLSYLEKYEAALLAFTGKIYSKKELQKAIMLLEVPDDHPLLVACASAAPEKVAVALNEIKSPNIIGRNSSKTPLGIATKNNDVACAKLLLEAGADFLAYGKKMTPAELPSSDKFLYNAVHAGHTGEFVKLMLKARAGVYYQGTNPDAMAFVAAAQRGNFDDVKEMINHGLDFNNCRFGTGSKVVNSLFYQMISDSSFKRAENFPAFCKMMLAHGANPNAIDIESKFKTSVLEAAVSEQIYPVVELLLAAGANPNYLDGVGRTPLYYSQRTMVNSPDKEKITRRLLAAGANPYYEHRTEQGVRGNFMRLAAGPGVPPEEIINHYGIKDRSEYKTNNRGKERG